MNLKISMTRRDQAHRTLEAVRLAVEFGPRGTDRSLGDYLGVPPDQAVANAKERARALISNNYWPDLRDYLAKLREWLATQP